MDQHDIANYADENTPYVSGKNIDEVVESIEQRSRLILNSLVTISFKESKQMSCVVKYWPTSTRKHRYRTTKLSFETNTHQRYGKRSSKLKALARIDPFTIIEKI